MEPTSKDLALPNAMRSDTSTRLRDSTDSQPSKRIWLEVGHSYEPRWWKSGRAVPEDWCVWVRGVAGADITAHVDKVVFQLCPDTQFPYPKRICLDAPYQLEEAGSAPTEVLIDVHLKCNTKPKQFQLKYGSLFNKAKQSSAASRCIFYDLQNPLDQLRMGLMKSPTQSSDSVPVMIPDRGEVKSHPHLPRHQTTRSKTNHKSNKFVEPADPVLSHKKMLLFESCDICDSFNSKSSKSHNAICPLLHQKPTLCKSHEFENPVRSLSPHIPSVSVSKVYRQLNERHRNIMFKESSIKPNHYTRRGCLRCLTRVTPCPSCQPRRVPHH